MSLLCLCGSTKSTRSFLQHQDTHSVCDSSKRINSWQMYQEDTAEVGDLSQHFPGPGMDMGQSSLKLLGHTAALVVTVLFKEIPMGTKGFLSQCCSIPCLAQNALHALWRWAGDKASLTSPDGAHNTRNTWLRRAKCCYWPNCLVWKELLWESGECMGKRWNVKWMEWSMEGTKEWGMRKHRVESCSLELQFSETLLWGPAVPHFSGLAGHLS